jgi:hypothetical protein
MELTLKLVLPHAVAARLTARAIREARKLAAVIRELSRTRPTHGAATLVERRFV